MREVKDPLSLLTPDSLDLGAKVLFARYYLEGINCDFAKELYRKHLLAWNGFQEIDPPKASFEDYLSSFVDIIEAIRNGSFDFKRSPIPIDANRRVRNGRHRLAAAIACGSPVMVKENADAVGQESSDWVFFQYVGLDEKSGDAMASEYARLKKNTYVANVFAEHQPEQILEVLREYGRPVYWKKIELERGAGFNLMREFYLDEVWLSDWKAGFPGAREKARLCLEKTPQLTSYLFECESLERVLECKKKLRGLFGGNQHSLHINDTHEETMRLVRVLFNQNSLHFLGWSNFQKFPGFNKMLREYRAFLADKNVEDFCIDGSAVLAAYGLRECRDLDYLDRNDVPGPSDLINNHNEEMRYHITHKDDLIYNPNNHFWHSGVKFVALHALTGMKSNRGEKKDRKDVSMMLRLRANWVNRLRKRIAKL